MQSMILSLFLLTTACSKSDSDNIVLPSNLEIQVSTSGSSVTVKATAQNTNFFLVYFGESASATPFKTSDGNAVYTYAASGTYTIRVEAHVTQDKFISDTKDVTIQVRAAGEIPTTGYTTPTSYAGMSLVWQDEFDGTSLDPASWTFETGGGGWGNHELEYYQNDNTTVKDGYLIITAKKETVGSNNYTSSRIKTQDKKAFKYGRVDIRAVLPKGQGLWPALWTLGSSISNTPWPSCGEIDIMEIIGGGADRDNKVYGTAHWGDGTSNTHASYGGSHVLSSGIFADEFHVFSIVWDASFITWYVDDIQYNKIDITPAGLDEFQKPFFFVFNVAVGGDWPGSPNGTTVFPQTMVVDYIRVFQ